MIEQKDAIQLIGKWGYSPNQFIKRLTDLRVQATEIGERCGVTAYSSLLALAKYALTGDALNSVRENDESFSEERRDRVNQSIIDNMNQEPTFASDVIERIYNDCLPCRTFKDADVAIRAEIMGAIAPVIVSGIADLGIKTASQVLQCIIGMDNAREDDPMSFKKIQRTTLTMDAFVQRILSYKNEMLEAHKEEGYNTLMRTLLENSDDMDNILQQSILSIIDRPPHVWVKFATNMGILMSGFILSMSFGFITYDEYSSIVEEFKGLIEEQARNSDTSVKFGRN